MKKKAFFFFFWGEIFLSRGIKWSREVIISSIYFPRQTHHAFTAFCSVCHTSRNRFLTCNFFFKKKCLMRSFLFYCISSDMWRIFNHLNALLKVLNENVNISQLIDNFNFLNYLMKRNVFFFEMIYFYVFSL